jgi:hypothetical protein
MGLALCPSGKLPPDTAGKDACRYKSVAVSGCDASYAWMHGLFFLSLHLC